MTNHNSINPFLPIYLKEHAKVDTYTLVKYSVKYKDYGYLGINVKLTLFFENNETKKVKKVSYQHGYGCIEFNVTGDDYLYTELNKQNLQYDQNLVQILKDSAYTYSGVTNKKEASYSQKM